MDMKRWHLAAGRPMTAKPWIFACSRWMTSPPRPTGLVCSGLSTVQVKAIARSVEDRLEESQLPLRKEGFTEGRWVLLDYGDVIVQVLTPEERSYYDLEAFWGHGTAVPFVPGWHRLDLQPEP